jgi:hypothetical protein
MPTYSLPAATLTQGLERYHRPRVYIWNEEGRSLVMSIGNDEDDDEVIPTDISEGTEESFFNLFYSPEGSFTRLKRRV